MAGQTNILIQHIEIVSWSLLGDCHQYDWQVCLWCVLSVNGYVIRGLSLYHCPLCRAFVWGPVIPLLTCQPYILVTSAWPTAEKERIQQEKGELTKNFDILMPKQNGCCFYAIFFQQMYLNMSSAICRWHIQIHFVERKLFCFESDFNGSLLGPFDQKTALVQLMALLWIKQAIKWNTVPSEAWRHL